MHRDLIWQCPICVAVQDMDLFGRDLAEYIVCQRLKPGCHTEGLVTITWLTSNRPIIGSG